MCGIIGVIGSAPKDLGQLKKGLETMWYRGPDADGFWHDDLATFGHLRLSVIDLSPAGNQPMHFDSLVLVYNGEIYNYLELRQDLRALGYEFIGNSDTEVLLKSYHAWGKDCVKRFNGMWAFAIWDPKKRELFCSRDRFGIKPFYYFIDGNLFIFASEIKGILTYCAKAFAVCRQSVADYLLNGYSGSQATWFQGICKLSPAHTLTINIDENGRIRTTLRRYWEIPEDLGLRANPEEILALLENSVALRLRSDVPFGFHLSGGLDSSSIVALAAQKISRPDTFSGYFNEMQAYDERPHIAELSRSIALNSQVVRLTPEDLRENLEHLVWLLDHPEAGFSTFAQYRINEIMKESGKTVAIGGQGGDEIFAGYYHYIPSFIKSLLLQKKWPKLAAESCFFLLNPFIRKELYRFCRRRSLKTRPDRILHPELAGAVQTNIYGWSSFATDLWTRLKNDVEIHLPSLLHVEDRTSMAWSIESRLPLLDYRLVEYLFRTASVSKIHHGRLKSLLRAAVHNLIPPAICRRQDKVGFNSPLGLWFNGELKDWLTVILGQRQLRISEGFIQPVALRQALTSHHWPDRDQADFLWKAVNIEVWLQKFGRWLTW